MKHFPCFFVIVFLPCIFITLAAAQQPQSEMNKHLLPHLRHLQDNTKQKFSTHNPRFMMERERREKYNNHSLKKDTSGFTSWQWLNPLPQGNTLFDIEMFDSVNTISVGKNETVLRTKNGGYTWNVKHNIGGTTNNIVAVSFNGVDTGFAVGGNTIFRTTNGGLSWLTTQTPYATELYDVFLVDNNYGTIVGIDKQDFLNPKGVIIQTSNGGISWEKKFTIPNTYLSGVYFIDKNKGSVSGGPYYMNYNLYGTILRAVLKIG